MYYILKGKEPVAIEDIHEWAKQFDREDGRVALTEYPNGVRVSTVFLGIDHSYNPYSKVPILFETMVFGGRYDQEQERYCTWDAAVIGHQEMCAKVEESITPWTEFVAWIKGIVARARK